MRNLLVNIAYNGARYHGYQVQKNAIAVAEVLQNAIEKVLKVREDIVGCSRTDTKVHANDYYFNMKTENAIPTDKLVIALNCFLPDDVCVKSCREMPMEFHARYHTVAKEYVYKIWNSDIKNPFLKDLVYQYKYKLDVELLNKVAQDYVGTYDYKAFSSAGGQVEDTVRTIHYFEVTRCGEMVEFKVCGDGFLYNMVRIMVGTLIRINEGQIKSDQIKQIIASKDRQKAGKTARPEGLYLNKVMYGSEWFGTDK